VQKLLTKIIKLATIITINSNYYQLVRYSILLILHDCFDHYQNYDSLVNNKMLRCRKTVSSQCFRCAEPKFAVRFFLFYHI